MSGTHPRKLELRCRTCGTLCYRGDDRHWTHEAEPSEPHDPDVRFFGRRKTKSATDPEGGSAGESGGEGAGEGAGNSTGEGEGEGAGAGAGAGRGEGTGEDARQAGTSPQ